jgi:hypothetical protein
MPPRMSAGESAVVAGTVSCSECGRMPLVGEWASLLEGRKSDRWVCELCRIEDGGVGVLVERTQLRSAALSNVRRVH